MGALIAVGQQPSPALRAAVDGGQVGRLLASRGGGPLRVAKRQRRGHVYGQRRQQEENQRRPPRFRHHAAQHVGERQPPLLRVLER